jgi:hypothetical protein
LHRATLIREGAEFEVDVINGGHVPMLSRSEAAVDVIRRFAEDTVESEVGARGNKL